MLSMQHCNKGGGYQWSQSSVQSRWWVGYVLLSEWLQCSTLQFSIIYKTTAVLYWVGGWYTYQKKIGGWTENRRGEAQGIAITSTLRCCSRKFLKVSRLFICCCQKQALIISKRTKSKNRHFPEIYAAWESFKYFFLFY